MRALTAPLSTSSIKYSKGVGTYKTNYVLTGTSTDTTVILDKIDGTPGSLVFVPNSSVAITATWMFTANNGSNYNATGIKLLNFWVNSQGVPTLTSNVVVSEPYSVMGVQVVQDATTKLYKLVLTTSGWGGGVVTHGSVDVQVITVIRV